MTRIQNGILILESEKDDICEYCGKKDELRPYGKNGARICYECGMKPENKDMTEKMLNEFLNGIIPQKIN